MFTEKKLSNKFVFWYHIIDTSSDQDYKSQIKKLAQFETLEEFWSIFQYLKKPDDFKQPIEIQLFKDGITPMWEDENNKNGGRISLKLRKEYSNLVWEELIFAFIGGYFDKEIKDEINGLVMNCKKDFNTLQIWTKNFNTEVNKGIEKNIRELLNIPKEVILEIKPFNMQYKEYPNNYNNYNNYNKQVNYMKKRQNNNYYKKRESYENPKENKLHENKEGNTQIEKEEKKEKNEEEISNEKIVEKKESKEIANENTSEKKEVKKKKKKKVEKKE